MLIFVIGCPGSGKGTLCKRWCESMNFEHFSLGDHLRALLNSRDGSLSADAQHRISQSELLETEDLLPIVTAVMNNWEVSGGPGIVLDGFPRTAEQITTVEDAIGVPELVLYFDCPKDVAKRRYMGRKLPGRDSDPGVFEKRFGEFEKLNDHVVEAYRRRGLLVEVDTSQESDVSYENLMQATISWHDVDRHMSGRSLLNLASSSGAVI